MDHLNNSMRPLCKCGQRPRAINYYKQGKTYYRKLCETCSINGLRAGVPRWKISGYVPKQYCEKCGFRSKISEIFKVYHIDGDLKNCRPSNLKTVCSNCSVEVSLSDNGWRQGDLVADY